MADTLILFTGMQLPTLNCLLELAREVKPLMYMHGGALCQGCYIILVGLLYVCSDTLTDARL